VLGKMPLKFYGASVPISMVLASLYFYYITQYKSGQNKIKHLKELDIVVHKKPSSCSITASTGDLVHLHYTSYLKSSGKQFETTREKADPYVFKLGTCNDKTKPECLKGFENGVLGMCAGEKRKVTIPPKLAYGKEGRPPDIKPDETVIFNIELVDIDK
ncbi:unnamed protein product, partial [Polarella glacialis]